MKSILFLTTVFCATIYAADEAQYTAMHYDDARDHDEVHTLLSNNVGYFTTLPADPTQVQQIKDLFANGLHTSLRNKTPMNPVPHVEGSFCTTLFRHQQELAGFITYYTRKDNANCFIDLIFIHSEDNTEQLPLLMLKTVLKYACEKKASYVQTYETTDKKEHPKFKQELLRAGLTKCEQTAKEKEGGVATLQFHTSAAINYFKLF